MRRRLRSLSRLCLPALLLALFGCGLGRNQFAPACPVAQLVPALADLTRYATAGAGGGHDLTDLILQARVVKVNGTCQPTDSKTILDASVQVSISVQRGPAMRGRQADVPVFVAVAEGNDVRDKQMFPVHVVFPPNVDRLTLTSQPIDMGLPVSQNVNGAAYNIISGFQLSPDELAANRQAAGG
ncbi:hypothetical protein [Rhodopila sp.]|uniref:hypothetical protein n=1 Tax=Rhodopila sp. TaxID=2480087 RepID=UPI003D1034C6